MWQLAGKYYSRLLLGTANYPSLSILAEAIKASHSNIITVSLKRHNPKDKAEQRYWDILSSMKCDILPNTAGCCNAREAIQMAQMAREIFETTWIKLEVIGGNDLLQPDPFELIKAAESLINMGFIVFPYCTEDTILCQKLVDVGCEILMPWGAPIGSGKGLLNPYALKILRERFPSTTLIIDAGIGSPIHAMQAMLMGYDAVLVNSAIAQSIDPVKMAEAFCFAIKSGKLALEAGLMPESDVRMSTPLAQTLFWK
jgi:thiazole synthase